MRNAHYRTWNMGRYLKMWIMRNTHSRTWNMARKTEKDGKFRNVHCRTWNMARKLKIMENVKYPLDHLKNDEITEKRKKWDMHTLGPGIWRENWTWLKMRNIHLTTWKMTKSLKNMKNEKCTLHDLGYGEKTENHGKWETSTWRLEKWRNHWKTWKKRNAHCRTWNMARKLEITENENNTR